MKICCLIDSLNSGGAQRQMTWLVRALTGNGHEVRLLTYHQYPHYLSLIRDCGVEPENIESSTKFGRFWNFRSAVRMQRPDVILSFLDTPNFIGLFAGMWPSRIPVIVSERNHDIGGRSRTTNTRFNLFRNADRVVTNSYSQAGFVSEHYPFLRSKLRTILNCVDLEMFVPSKRLISEKERKLIVAASIIPRKNAQNLIRGMRIAADQGARVSVDWYGNNLFHNGEPTEGSGYYLEAVELVTSLQLSEQFQFHDPVSNLHELYPTYDGCLLPSFREGCPNVICESMSAGLPALVSDHGDMKRMVDEAGGFRFAPHSPESIAESITQFTNLSSADCQMMGDRNRHWAEQHLSPERFASEYEAIIQEVVSA